MSKLVYLNKDKEYVKDIQQKIIDNDGYCICAIAHTPDTKCMCKAFREQESGYCHCELYYKTKD